MPINKAVDGVSINILTVKNNCDAFETLRQYNEINCVQDVNPLQGQKIWALACSIYQLEFPDVGCFQN